MNMRTLAVTMANAMRAHRAPVRLTNMAQHFIAYSSGDATHADTVQRAAKNASSSAVTYRPWASEEASASPVGEAVEAWIGDAEAVVADQQLGDFPVAVAAADRVQMEQELWKLAFTGRQG